MSSSDSKKSFDRCYDRMIANSKVSSMYLTAICSYKPYNIWEVNLNKHKNDDAYKFQYVAKRKKNNKSYEFGTYVSER